MKNLYGEAVAVTVTRDRLWKNRYKVSLCYIIKHPELTESIWHTKIMATFDHNETGAKIVAEAYSIKKHIPILREVKRGNPISPEEVTLLNNFQKGYENKLLVGV